MELVEDVPQRLGVFRGDGQPAVRLLGLVFPDVEPLDVEGAAEVHHRAEAALHRPAVDDVTFEFDGPRVGHTEASRPRGKPVSLDL